MGEAPRVGQIVDHHFLWVDEQAAGHLEGRKPRPCVIVAVELQDRGPPRVTVLPVGRRECQSARSQFLTT
jgi:hypothetical protein